MDVLIQVIGAGRASACCTQDLCEGCWVRQAEYLRSRTADDFFTEEEWSALATISWRAPSIVICDKCLADCRPIYEVAKRRVLAYNDLLPSRDGPLSPPAVVSMQLTAQRVALILAMPEMAIRNILPAGRAQIRGACAWCGVPDTEPAAIIMPRGAAINTGDRFDPAKLVIIHQRCVSAAADVFWTERMKQ